MNWLSRIEQFIQKQDFFLRVVLFPVLLLLYILRACFYSFILLFHSPQNSFAAFYPLTEKEYKKSYTSHSSWVRQLKIGVVASFLVSILTPAIFAWWSTARPVFAATCNISSSTTVDSSYISTNNCNDIHITGNATITFTESINLNGSSIFYVDSGVTATFSGALTLSDSNDSMVINGTVNQAAENTTGVNITAQTLTINSTGTINVNSLGCNGGSSNTTNANGPDTTTGTCTASTSGYGDSGTTGAGGSHGGPGGRGNDVFAGTIYDANAAPVLLGSGGGGSSSAAGASGGGIVRLNITGTLTVSGAISANGGVGSGANASGGGSGGSVYITAGTLTGTSTIVANGGNGFDGSSGDSGGGGGGRVAVYFNTNSSFTLGNITATKGLKGGPQNSAADGKNGSTFILDRKTDDGIGTLTIVSGIDFRSDGDYTRTNITIYNGAGLVCQTGVTSVTLGATATLDFQGVTLSCANIDTLNIIAATWTTSNTNTITVNKIGSSVDWDITNNLTLNNVTITGGVGGNSSDGGGWTLDNPINVSLVNSTVAANINWTGLASLNIDSNSTMTSNVKGCGGGPNNLTNGNGPDTTTGVCTGATSGYGDSGTTGAGGSHGGAGGRGNDSFTGTTYGTNTAPTLLGSGGGGSSSAVGGAGAGKIRLDTSGTLTLNGVITANGVTGSGAFGSGGGSGGSIYITTATLAGTGTIDADAGNGFHGASGDSGGGGGGRIAIYYVTDSNSIAANLGSGNVAGGSKGGSANNAADGASGTTYSLQYTVASTPTISTPSNNATNQSRNLTVTSSAYSANGSSTHTSTDWQISDDNTFSNDCSDTNLVYCKLASTNKTSIAVNSTNGTFQNTLSGKTLLAPNTIYYVRARYTNIAGNSSWSSSTSFTTLANTVPATPTNSTPANAATGQSVNPTLTSSAFSDADGDAHLSSSWRLRESADCTGNTVWSKSADATNLTSIAVNTTNGTFADTLAGQTRLKSHTTYSFQVQHIDTYSGTSSLSSCTSFTTTNIAPALATSVPDQTYLEDTAHSAAFDLDTYFSDVDFNDDDQYTCTASNGFSSNLGSMTINSDRTVDFSLIGNANGSDTIQFSCQDGGGLSTSSNSIGVTVTAVNDIPSFTKGGNQTVLEDSAAQTTATWATNISAGPSDESTQTISFVVANDNNGLFSSQPAVATNGTLTYTLAANANGSTTITLYAHDTGGGANSGVENSATQTFTITATAVNDAPSFVKGANQSVLEDAGAQTVSTWATQISSGPTDESSQTLSFTVTNDNNGLFSSQPAVSSSTGTLTYTPASNASGSATVTVALSDNGGVTNSGVDSSSQTFTITIASVNDLPIFTGSLPAVTFFAGTTASNVFDLKSYFADPENDSLSYSVTGAVSIVVTISGGVVSLSAPADFSGLESLLFKATDTAGGVTSSNTVLATVTENDTTPPEVPISDISFILGKSEGEGSIQVVGKDNTVLAQWVAFPIGGVIPRIAKVNDVYYVYAVKRHSGTTMHIYSLSGQLIMKRHLSPGLHWRRLTAGNLDNDSSDQEIVISTKRDGSVYLKVFSFSPEEKTLTLRSSYLYGPVKSFNYVISISKKTLHLVGSKGKTLLDWQPFK